jgi:hypothetical protein
MSALKTKAGAAAVIGTTGVAATVAGVAIHSAYMAPAESQRQTRSSVIFAIEGKDLSGRRGTFDVVVAKKEILWARGSAEELEKDGKIYKSVEIAPEIFDAEVTAALKGAKEIIAVGTASQEGDAVEETARAGKRAAEAAKLAAAAAGTGIPVWSLNLGQYRDPCADCETAGTSWQRPFIVIAAKELETGTVVSEALADALTGKSKLPSPKSYSAFEISRVR